MGDGLAERIIVTPDGREMMLSPAKARAQLRFVRPGPAAMLPATPAAAPGVPRRHVAVRSASFVHSACLCVQVFSEVDALAVLMAWFLPGTPVGSRDLRL